MSENISVRSIVGNFLEHSRIFYFENNGAPKLYMGSADWMPRNLDKRVEIVFPVESENVRIQVMHILEIQLADNVKAHILQPDGSYEKPDRRGKQTVNSQSQFCEEAIQNTQLERKKADPTERRTFIPIESQEE